MHPQSRAPAVLITRPQPQADRFARALTLRYGDRVEAIVTPMLAVRALSPMLPVGPFGAIVLTSESGARAAHAMAGALPRRAYCVGDRTALVAAEGGFDPVSADGDADALFDLLCRDRDAGPFLHLRGSEARGDLAARMAASGIAAAESVIYAQEPQPLSQQARVALDASETVIAPLFSPRSAEVFRRALLAFPSQPSLKIVALSPAVAEVWADLPKDHVAVAAGPTQAELFIAMDRFINTG